METKHNETVYKMANHKKYSQLCSKPADDLSIDGWLLHKRISWTDNINPFTIHLTPIVIESKCEANQVLSFASHEEELYSPFLPGSVKGEEFYFKFLPGSFKGEEFCFTREKDPGQLLPESVKGLNACDKVLSFPVIIKKDDGKVKKDCDKAETFMFTPHLFLFTIQLFPFKVQSFLFKVHLLIFKVQMLVVKVHLLIVTVQLFIVTPQTFPFKDSRHRYTEATMPPPWNVVNVSWIHYLLIFKIKINENNN